MELSFGKLVHNIEIYIVITLRILLSFKLLQAFNTYMHFPFWCSELINKAVPDTIDPRAINYAKNGKVSIFKQHENLTLAVQSARVR